MSSNEFHVAAFPWFAAGHITPYLHLSNKLAERGCRVSFFIPTKTKERFNHLNLHPHLIHFIPLTVPQVDGLPPGIETMSDIPMQSNFVLLLKAFDLTKDQVQVALQNLQPNAVIFEFPHWLPKIAHSLRIKCIFYSTTGAAVVSSVFLPSMVPLSSCDEMAVESVEPTHHNDEVAVESVKPSTHHKDEVAVESVEPTHHKDEVAVESVEPSTHHKDEVAVESVEPTEPEHNEVSFFHREATCLSESDVICFRGYQELDGHFCDQIKEQLNKQVLLVGMNLKELSNDPLEEKWAKWLGGFDKESVVYCALGSECVLEKDQFKELIFGLELTGLPFLARLRPPAGVETVEEALPEGFKERVGGRGIVHEGWVQQQQILNHPSVGCFVSHCGYGSMCESLVSSCQIVLIPQVADQFLNANYITNELKVGVEVERREEDKWFTREGVCKAVKMAMDEGSEVGQEIRANHCKLKELLCTEGLESTYLDKFVLKLHEILHENIN